MNSFLTKEELHEARRQLASRIHTAREGRRLTGRKAAEAIEVSHRTYYLWESGAFAPRTPATFSSLAQALGFKPSRFSC